MISVGFFLYSHIVIRYINLTSESASQDFHSDPIKHFFYTLTQNGL